MGTQLGFQVTSERLDNGVTIDLATAAPYQSVDEVIQGLAAIEVAFHTALDRRAIFASAYLIITMELKDRIDAGFFLDNDWVARCLVAFANLYRQALHLYESGKQDIMPKSWRISFEASQRGRALAVQDLLLGINAHINHDLALSLEEVSIDPDREKRYQDHTAINDALRDATNRVQQRLSEMYTPVLQGLDLAGGILDEELTNFSFQKARQAAWVAGLALTNARSDGERAAIRQSIDDHSAVLARLMLVPSRTYPALVQGMRQLEQLSRWWHYLPPITSGTELPRIDGAAPPIVNSLDELTHLLQATIERFDEQGSKLSIYPTIYLAITQGFKEALQQGGHFEDNEWIVHLDLQFANLYFKWLAAFEDGRLDEIPQCWVSAFQATAADEVTILQALVLAINARLNYDLALALFNARIDDDMAKRRRDLEKIHTIFKAGIDPVQELLARKYSKFLRVLDLLGGEFDELLVDFSYTRARDSAWDIAVALTEESNEHARQQLILDLDRRTNARAQKILLRGLHRSSWVIQAIKYVESRYSGRWSQWVTTQ